MEKLKSTRAITQARGWPGGRPCPSQLRLARVRVRVRVRVRIRGVRDLAPLELQISFAHRSRTRAPRSVVAHGAKDNSTHTHNRAGGYSTHTHNRAGTHTHNSAGGT